jgi:hypothetical protein
VLISADWKRFGNSRASESRVSGCDSMCAISGDRLRTYAHTSGLTAVQRQSRQ